MRHIYLVSLALLLFASPFASSQGGSHRAMLASVYSEQREIQEYWVSEKLDGVRGHWDGKGLWSRGGHRISTPDWFTEGWPTTAMDGELWIARGRFDAVSGIARSTRADDKEWQRVKFMVFDLPGHGGVFSRRVEEMAEIKDYGIPWLQPIGSWGQVLHLAFPEFCPPQISSIRTKQFRNLPAQNPIVKQTYHRYYQRHLKTPTHESPNTRPHKPVPTPSNLLIGLLTQKVLPLARTSISNNPLLDRTINPHIGHLSSTARSRRRIA